MTGSSISTNFDAGVDARLHERAETFDSLGSKYLAVKAKLATTSCPTTSATPWLMSSPLITWRIIRTSAVLDRHVDHKLDLITEYDVMNAQHFALIESIRQDVT